MLCISFLGSVDTKHIVARPHGAPSSLPQVTVIFIVKFTASSPWTAGVTASSKFKINYGKNGFFKNHTPY
jgi:hypothetical protein